MLAALLLAPMLLAQEVVPTAPSEVAPPPPPAAAVQAAPPAPEATPGDLSTAPPLPGGALVPVARDAHGETFLVADHAGAEGGAADFWTFEVFLPAVNVSPGEDAVQGLAHHEVDCPSRTDRIVASAGYDEQGQPIVALAAGPAAPLAVGSAYDLIASKLCAGRPIPADGALAGHLAALSQARAGQ